MNCFKPIVLLLALAAPLHAAAGTDWTGSPPAHNPGEHAAHPCGRYGSDIPECVHPPCRFNERTGKNDCDDSDEIQLRPMRGDRPEPGSRLPKEDPCIYDGPCGRYPHPCEGVYRDECPNGRGFRAAAEALENGIAAAPGSALNALFENAPSPSVSAGTVASAGWIQGSTSRERLKTAAKNPPRKTTYGIKIDR